tara:strand:+ start:473 stop:634 length:162 start_codon:yes stop_codon:yes gene_type:complete
VPTAFFLAEKTHNKDLEIPPCRLHPNFCFAKTSLNPHVKSNNFLSSLIETTLI